VRELKVAVVGAGLAGITAGVLLPAKVPGIKLTIFEKNNDVVRMNTFLDILCKD
jgi:protoporphyrinogen oxidase